ncbi:MAG: S8 family serine peptidase [Actinomycetota bacterium]|nr:S8 family serine peptidase [Actinomycetota bacterium]
MGVDVDQPDLAVAGHVTFEGSQNGDCNGHGTHVAGSLAARDDALDVVGVAPGVSVTGVKVLGCNLKGPVSSVIAGVEWVTQHARRPAVANLSLGTGPSQALYDAVRRSAAGGILYAVAAGNETADACGSSPARAGRAPDGAADNGVVTVAATDLADREASWSNAGACVDLWAPGTSILSTRRGGGRTTMSGTSMAAPHVAGGAALALARQPLASPATVEAQLRGAAQPTGTHSRDGGASCAWRWAGSRPSGAGRRSPTSAAATAAPPRAAAPRRRSRGAR